MGPADFDIFHVCVDATSAAGLDFVLIGGHAVNARGYVRTTIDFDFLIAARDLQKWGRILDAAGYRLITEEVKTFAQFEPKIGENFRVDLMLVDDSTLGKLLAGSEWRDYGGRRIRVAGVLHLIALKLHALRSDHRFDDGKDFYDILNLVRRNRIDHASPEFQSLIDRYADLRTRDRLARELGRPE